jgi:AcrR family transcriptional regulator
MSAKPSSTAIGDPHRERAAHLGPERRRPMILDAAFAVFLEHGYEGASMEKIAREAGVTKPVVYACYASKEELFTALLAREEGRIIGQIAAALPARADEDLERTLSDALTAFLRAVADSAAAYRVIFLGEGGGNAAISKRVQRGRELQVDAVAMLVHAWLVSRQTDDAETTARLIAHALVGAAEAAARAVLAEPDQFKPDVVGPMLARLITRGERAL